VKKNCKEKLSTFNFPKNAQQKTGKLSATRFSSSFVLHLLEKLNAGFRLQVKTVGHGHQNSDVDDA